MHFLPPGWSGKHRRHRHRRWEPQADTGTHLEHYPSLAGELTHTTSYYRCSIDSLFTDDHKKKKQMTESACLHANMLLIICVVRLTLGTAVDILCCSFSLPFVLMSAYSYRTKKSPLSVIKCLFFCAGERHHEGHHVPSAAEQQWEDPPELGATVHALIPWSQCAKFHNKLVWRPGI